MVAAITTLSLVYQNVLPQVILNILILSLLLILSPSRERWQRMRRRLYGWGRLALALLVFQALFRHQGNTWAHWGWIRITSGGIEAGVTSSLRFLLILLSAGLLCDYPFPSWLRALRAWKFPYELAFLVANTMQFIPLLDEQFRQSREALRLRGVELNRLPLTSRMRALSVIVLPIVAQTLHQVRYRAASLELRGFRLSPRRTELYSRRLGIADMVIQTGTLLLTGFLLIGTYFFY